MKIFKNLFILTMVIWGLTAFSQKIHADTNDLSAEQVMSTINSRGSKVIYHTRRSATLSGLTNTIMMVFIVGNYIYKVGLTTKILLQEDSGM
ncbi:hypothetical protein ACR0Q6_03690 [Enterococcus lactis]|uniref:hypothetical protein n=1 Tax=Enterococcus lactis TaxID=357441 RepID=UPI003D9821B5